MSADEPLKPSWFPAFHKTWKSLGFPGQLAILTTTLIVLSVPLAIITMARPTDPRSQALDSSGRPVISSVTPSSDGPVPVKSGCIVGGCSSELCVDASLGPVSSPCLWKEEYACYRTATCKRQADGRCAWTKTPELDACLGGTVIDPGAATAKPKPTSSSGQIPTPIKCIPRPPCLDAVPACKLMEPAAGWCPPTRITPPPSTKPTCSPRPACLDAQLPCNIPFVPPGGWCPTTTRPTSTPAATSTQQAACTRGGGTWRLLSDSCVDSCSNLSHRGCATVMTYGCDCGTAQCWNGSSCTVNPSTGTLPTTKPTSYPTVKPTTFPTTRPTCTPRPACLDAQPPCQWIYVPPGGWCPASRTTPPSTKPSITPLTPSAGRVCDLICPDGYQVTPNCLCEPFTTSTTTLPTSINRPTTITKSLPALMQNHFYLATIAAQDLDVNDKVSLTIEGLPAGLQMERCLPSNAPGKALVSCSITGTSKAAPGNYTLTIRATDSQGNVSAQTVTLTVIPPETWFRQFMDRFRSIVSLR